MVNHPQNPCYENPNGCALFTNTSCSGLSVPGNRWKVEGNVANFSSLQVKSWSNTAACLTLDPVTLNATAATCLSTPPLPATQGFIIHCNPWWCDPQGGVCLSCEKAAFCGQCAAGWYVTLLGQCSTWGCELATVSLFSGVLRACVPAHPIQSERHAFLCFLLVNMLSHRSVSNRLLSVYRRADLHGMSVWVQPDKQSLLSNWADLEQQSVRYENRGCCVLPACGCVT